MLGMPRGMMIKQMTSREITEWMGYFSWQQARQKTAEQQRKA